MFALVGGRPWFNLSLRYLSLTARGLYNRNETVAFSRDGTVEGSLLKTERPRSSPK